MFELKIDVQGHMFTLLSPVYDVTNEENVEKDGDEDVNDLQGPQRVDTTYLVGVRRAHRDKAGKFM